MNGHSENHRKRLPPLTALKTFESVARLMSFKDAADELFVTPSAVSHQMRQLEDFLGVKLFTRNPRNIDLTNDGTQYYESIASAFDDINLATSKIISKRKSVVLSLNVPSFFYEHWLKRHIDSFLGIHPEVELVIIDPKHNKLKDNSKDEVVINILWGNKKILETDYTLFLNSPGVVVCSPDILHHDVPFIDKDYLSTYKQLHMSVWPYAWEHMVNSLGVKPAPQHRIKYFDYNGDLILALLSGEGVAICDNIIAQDYIKSGKLVPLLDFTIPSNNSFYLSHDPELSEHYILRAFKEWISAETNKI